MDTSDPVLDHTSFPHILELITDYAVQDVPTALAMRCADRNLRDTVDARLFSHVAVIEKAGKCMELRSIIPPHHHLPCKPSFEDHEEADTDEDVKSRTRMLKYIRRADYFPQHTSHWVYSPPSEFGNGEDEPPFKLEYIRRVQSSSSGYRQHAGVSFIGSTSIDFADITGGRLPIHPFADVHSNEGTERHIIHINYDPAHPNLYQCLFHGRVAPSVRELVYVFNPYPDSKPYDGVKDHISPHLGMLYGMLTSMMPVLGRGGKVTFVGVDEIPHVHLDHPSTLSTPELITAVKAHVSEWILEWEEFLFDQPDQFGYGTEGISWKAEDIERSVQSVTFHTRGEWRKSLPLGSLDDTAPEYDVPETWAPPRITVHLGGEFDEDDDYLDFEDFGDYNDYDDFFEDYDNYDVTEFYDVDDFVDHDDHHLQFFPGEFDEVEDMDFY
jgi:hypothetical protein